MFIGLFIMIFGAIVFFIALMLSNQIVIRIKVVKSLFGKTILQLLITSLIMLVTYATIGSFIGPNATPEKLVGTYSNLRIEPDIIEIKLHEDGSFTIVSPRCVTKYITGKWYYDSGDLYDYVNFELHNGQKFRAKYENEAISLNSVNIQNCSTLKGRLVLTLK